jgi:hypothetical protein
LAWRQAALAAVAGFASLAVSLGGTAAIFILLVASVPLGAAGMAPIVALMGMLIAIAVTCASFWIPALVLGARGSQATLSVVLAGVTFVLSIVLFLPIYAPSDTAKHATVILMFTLAPAVLTTTATWPRITTSYRLALAIIVATAVVYALALVVFRSVTDPVYEIPNRYEYGVLIAGASWVLVPALAGARRLS